MIGALLKARHVSFGVTAVALVLLAVFGKRVSYEQSIKSFFADDDPHMARYQAAAKVFGDDNFVFIAYDDPELLTAAGMDRVAELAAAVGPAQINGVLRVESLDAYAAALEDRRRPAGARPAPRLRPQPGPGRGPEEPEEPRPEDQRDDRSAAPYAPRRATRRRWRRSRSG